MSKKKAKGKLFDVCVRVSGEMQLKIRAANETEAELIAGGLTEKLWVTQWPKAVEEATECYEADAIDIEGESD